MSAGFSIRVLDSKPVGVSKGDYAFHSSEVDQISMKNGKKKTSSCIDSAGLGDLNTFHGKGL